MYLGVQIICHTQFTYLQMVNIWKTLTITTLSHAIKLKMTKTQETERTIVS
jgi:hypothetical protein